MPHNHKSKSRGKADFTNHGCPQNGKDGAKPKKGKKTQVEIKAS